MTHSLGKWSKPGVPHHGWVVAGVEDLGEPAMTCEMCEHQEIRYVHLVTHADYPDELSVGSVCVEAMVLDYDAKGVERGLKNKAARELRRLEREAAEQQRVQQREQYLAESRRRDQAIEAKRLWDLAHPADAWCEDTRWRPDSKGGYVIQYGGGVYGVQPSRFKTGWYWWVKGGVSRGTFKDVESAKRALFRDGVKK